MKGLRRILLRNFAGIGLLDLPLSQSAAFAGLPPKAEEALRAALAFCYLPESAAPPGECFSAPDAFLAFEIQGATTLFTVLCSAPKGKLAYRLLPGPWDASLAQDADGRFTSLEQAERIWKKLKLKVSPPLSAEAMLEEVWQGEPGSPFYQGISITPALRRALFTCALHLRADDFWSLLLPDQPPQARISLDALRADLAEHRSLQEERLMLASLAEEIEAAGALLSRLRELQAEESEALQRIRVSYHQIQRFFCEPPAQKPPAGGRYASPLGRLLQQRFDSFRLLESEMAEAQGKLPERYLAREQARREAAAAREKLQADKEALTQGAEERMEQIQARLRDLAQDEKRPRASGLRFRDWLEDRYPDWRQSIGKVCRPELLEHPWLSPQIERINDLLFGIRLDLSDLPEPVLGALEQESEPADREARRQQLQKQWVHEKEALAQQLLQCEKKHKARIQESTRELTRIQYELEQAEVTLKRLRLEKEEHLRQTLLMAEKHALDPAGPNLEATHPLWQQLRECFPALGPAEASAPEDAALDPEKCVQAVLRTHEQAAQVARQLLAAASAIGACLPPDNPWRIRTRCGNVPEAASLVEQAAEALRAALEAAPPSRSTASILGALAKAHSEIGQELKLLYQRIGSLAGHPFAVAPSSWELLLSEIACFWQEHQDQIGEPSLLNPEPDPAANQQAWQLLSKLEAACLQSAFPTLDARHFVQLSGPSAGELNAAVAVELLSMARKHLPALPALHIWLPPDATLGEKLPEGLIALQAERPQPSQAARLLYFSGQSARSVWSFSHS